MIVLNDLQVDPKFYESQLAGIQGSPAYPFFGDSMMISTYTNWLDFLVAGHDRAQQFLAKYHHQYQIPGVWALLANIKNCIERSVGTNDPRFLVATIAYARSANLLIGSVQSLRTDSEPFEPLHPSFTPSDEEWEWFLSYISVLTKTTEFLWAAFQVAYQTEFEREKAAREATEVANDQ